MSDAVTPDDSSSATESADVETPEVQDAAVAVEEAPVEADAPAAAPIDAGPAGSTGAESRENPRKVREGIVVSTGMDKTAVVEAVDRVRHRRYAKTVQRSTKLFAHDENNDANVGDRVRIQETRPMSKKKHWRLVEIIERAR